MQAWAPKQDYMFSALRLTHFCLHHFHTSPTTDALLSYVTVDSVSNNTQNFNDVWK